ncbi:MBL fold metallo-hydrolase [Streptosporangium vulgare]|uniref:MBL fold metallo-hydrolase n=1 Tax=Streptosporangium vulgare TaxID=46190 RepID=UPI0031D47AB5
MTTTITVIGGPTALLELGGLRILTDPTFDPPGDHPAGPLTLTKTAGPALSPADIGRVDLVLLSHDQHPDNLDGLGRRMMSAVPLTLSTPEAAARTGVTPMLPWQHHDVGRVRVTAVPALHGPPGCEPVVGQVTGFVLTGHGLPTVYVSGDNALAGVRGAHRRAVPGRRHRVAVRRSRPRAHDRRAAHPERRRDGGRHAAAEGPARGAAPRRRLGTLHRKPVGRAGRLLRSRSRPPARRPRPGTAGPPGGGGGELVTERGPNGRFTRPPTPVTQRISSSSPVASSDVGPQSP